MDEFSENILTTGTPPSYCFQATPRGHESVLRGKAPHHKTRHEKRLINEISYRERAKMTDYTSGKNIGNEKEKKCKRQLSRFSNSRSEIFSEMKNANVFRNGPKMIGCVRSSRYNSALSSK